MAAISCRTCFRNIRFCRNVSHHGRRRAQTTRHLCSSSGDKDVKDHDPPAFNDATVQKLLKRITGMNFEKIFPRVKQKLSPPKYKLVSEDKLQELLEEAKEKAEKKLQMPPVMEERTKIDHVLSNDPELEGLETSKLVFTDITFGVPDR
ncbi:small ribosomal subunit protein mS22-like, partial [Saccoglossus kowalevskii]|uniref:28S ribosomal protein S22, mitochondrial-like n=1 Tax=Saccoglossus kowalevskii TaxID=10224 RepID=A0ABM0MDF0_SACKO